MLTEVVEVVAEEEQEGMVVAAAMAAAGVVRAALCAACEACSSATSPPFPPPVLGVAAIGALTAASWAWARGWGRAVLAVTRSQGWWQPSAAVARRSGWRLSMGRRKLEKSLHSCVGKWYFSLRIASSGQCLRERMCRSSPLRLKISRE